MLVRHHVVEVVGPHALPVEATFGNTLQVFAGGTSIDSALGRRSSREDLVELMARGVGIRLVKGAYNEPAEVACPKKSDVDANYYALAQLMLDAGSRASGARAVFGTHDAQLIDSIRRHAAATGVKPAEFELHMLDGIQKATQLRLAQDGASVRVLIAYGAYWFPWYMRRLAERPANVWFVAKSLFG